MKQTVMLVRCSLCLWIVGWFLVTPGCDHDLGEPTSGQSVSGTVTYEGEAHLAFERPYLQVAAFATFPPSGPPHASITIPNPDFTQGGVDYELPFLLPYKYYVMANLIDMSHPNDLSGPLGAWPNNCSLGDPEGPVEVSAGEGLSGIDLHLFDNGGATDPCYRAPVDICPRTGFASVVMTVTSETALGATDSLTYAMFNSWPPTGAPVRFQRIEAGDLSLPLAVVDNAVPSQELVLYLCLDRTGGSAMDMCGEGDLLGLYNQGVATTYEADMLHFFAFDLDSGSLNLLSVDSPDLHGCGEDVADGPGAVEVEVRSLLLEPEPGDMISAALFTSFPPTGGPVRVVQEEVSEFPVTLLIEAVEAGEYYLNLCFDAGGDDMMCDGEGDVSAWYAGGAQALTVEAERTSAVEVDLDGEIPRGTSLLATLTSTQITPEAGDVISVSLFGSFPAAGPPVATQRQAVTEFPATVVLSDLTAGDYYLMVCFDRGGDNIMCNGEGDIMIWYQDGAASLNIAEAETAEVTISLDP